MSKEVDRKAVFRTTKVRTTLKGDNSWIQRRQEAEAELEDEEKPRLPITEVNGSASKQAPTSLTMAREPPSATNPESTRPLSSGYLIRGVFTKTEGKKPPASPTGNGTSSAPSVFTKKPTDSYKKIATHAVRTSSENPPQDGTLLSSEEQQKRTEAASSVLSPSATRQRSYVFSAAKKSADVPTDTSPSFLAKRVVICDDEENVAPRTQKDIKALVPTPVETAAKPKPATQSSPKEDKLSSSSDILITFDTNTSSNVKGSTAFDPTPLTPTSSKGTEVVLDKGTKAKTSPAKASPQTLCEPTPAPTNNLDNADLLKLMDSEEKFEDPSPSTTGSRIQETLPRPSSSKNQSEEASLDGLAVDIIPIDTNTSSLSTDLFWSDTSTLSAIKQPSSLQSPTVSKTVSDSTVITKTSVTEQKTRAESPFGAKTVTTTVTKTSLTDPVAPLKKPENKSTDISSKGTEVVLDKGTKAKTSPAKASPQTLCEPTPAPTNNLDNADLLKLMDSGEKFEDPSPSTTGSRIQETLPRPSSSKNQSEEASLDGLAVDIIPIDTNTSSLSTDLFWSDTSTLSPIKQPSSLQREEPTLDALAGDVIPINTKTTSLISVTSLLDLPSTGNESFMEEADGDQPSFTVKFERKSSVSDSPWNRWTSPIVSETTKQRAEAPSTETITTTTVRTEMHSTLPSSLDRALDTASPETTSSDSESKKGIVYVKEYVNASTPSQYDSLTSDYDSLGSDYVSSRASSYTHSSPSSYSRSMSPCSYCGELVGSEGKITVEHLNISCHPACFKCGVCSKPMGDLLYNMFLHGGVVHCESCYSSIV